MRGNFSGGRSSCCKVVGDDAHIVPTKYGTVVEKIMKTILGIDKYVIIPNHFHLIVKNENGTMWASSPTESRRTKQSRLTEQKNYPPKRKTSFLARRLRLFFGWLGNKRSRYRRRGELCSPDNALIIAAPNGRTKFAPTVSRVGETVPGGSNKKLPTEEENRIPFRWVALSHTVSGRENHPDRPDRNAQSLFV